jgi:DUF971 family protein
MAARPAHRRATAASAIDPDGNAAAVRRYTRCTMADPTPTAPAPRPLSLTLHQASRLLEIDFDDGASYRIPFELMRVYSPSAEVMGHGPGQETLQTGKREVGIVEITPVGHYAVQPRFSDGHDTGIFSWDYLYRMGRDQADLWQRYEERLRAAGANRDAAMVAAAGKSCGH